VTPGCDGYSLLLAVEDVLPIVLGAIGFLALRRRVTAAVPATRTPVTLAVVALIAGSAIAGPTRKALVAFGADCEQLQWMQVPFFLALPIGFAILGWAVRCTLRSRIVGAWPFAAIAAVGVVGAIAAQRDVILLATGGLLAVVTAGSAARLARQQGDLLAAALLIGYAFATLSLPVVAAQEGVSAAVTLWAEQAVNTTAQALFALGAWRLARGFSDE
jgi:hypothetical protein